MTSFTKRNGDKSQWLYQGASDYTNQPSLIQFAKESPQNLNKQHQEISAEKKFMMMKSMKNFSQISFGGEESSH